jgi:uncharacterized cupin superfamily protein
MPDPVGEARLDGSAHGLAPATSGWFVVNARDAVWETNADFGASCFFEGEGAPFPDLGINLRLLEPGRFLLYHAEPYQEGFLVVAGACLLLVEGEERPLRAWDFVHCPPGTAHGLVATGAAPCILVMVGARTPGWPAGIAYPRSELALRHGAGVEEESSSVREVLARYPSWEYGRPESWDDLPWGP